MRLLLFCALNTNFFRNEDEKYIWFTMNIDCCDNDSFDIGQNALENHSQQFFDNIVQSLLVTYPKHQTSLENISSYQNSSICSQLLSSSKINLDNLFSLNSSGLKIKYFRVEQADHRPQFVQIKNTQIPYNALVKAIFQFPIKSAMTV